MAFLKRSMTVAPGLEIELEVNVSSITAHARYQLEPGEVVRGCGSILYCLEGESTAQEIVEKAITRALDDLDKDLARIKAVVAVVRDLQPPTDRARDVIIHVLK